MLQLLENLLSAIVVVLGVGFLIFVHELGHFVLAKLSKVRVEAFSLGFGPAIWKAIRGETEYRLSVIPLGGYVKMAGENPGEERKHAGDELWAKPPLNRFLIFAAGSFMNFVIAFPICITAYLLGVSEAAPVIGAITPASAEWGSGLQVGDEILELDGEPVLSLQDYQMAVMLADTDRDVAVTVQRGADRLQIPLRPAGPEGYGLRPVGLSEIADVIPETPAEKAGLRKGDVITAVDGVTVDSGGAVDWRIQERPGQPVRLTIRRKEAASDATLPPTEATLDLTVTPETAKSQALAFEEVVPAVIDQVKAHSPTFPYGTALASGDRVTTIVPDDDPAKRVKVTTWREFRSTIERMGGRKITLVVERGGKTVEVQARPHASEGGQALLYAAPQHTRHVVAVPPGSVWEKAGLAVGDEIVKVDGKEAFYLVMERDSTAPVPVEVRRNGQVNVLSIPPQPGRVEIGVQFKAQTLFQKYGFSKAVVVGSRKVITFIKNTVGTLKLLLLGRLSAKNLAGPVGIFNMSYKVAEQETTRFLWLLAFISINLAVVNMLPIPVLDGGHIMFLLIEMVRGRPVSEGVLIASQYVGLVLLLSLIVWVTFFDVIRVLG